MVGREERAADNMLAFISSWDERSAEPSTTIQIAAPVRSALARVPGPVCIQLHVY